MLHGSEEHMGSVDHTARKVEPHGCWQDRRDYGLRALGFLILSALVVLLMLTTGCFAMKLAQGGKGTDVISIQPGVSRANAEAILGLPVREWTLPTGIRCAVSHHDAGLPPNLPGAKAAALMGVLTLGMLELMVVITKPSFDNHITDGVVISCSDSTNRL